MAQFDIYRNTGRQQQSIPFVVVVQSSLYDHYQRRVVVPLVRRSTLSASDILNGCRMNPQFTIEEIEVVLHPLEIVSIGLNQLGEKIGSLAPEGNRIADALDELLTQAWK
ncbi:MAG: CcdB family protein [Gallionella sp.]|nr:CcdB family protein [Gallionella sp.]MDD4958958.1 CcdB family protein [Gallionella sp.]